MLEYIKTILTKVSFDAILFEKELRKGMDVLFHEEIDELKQWCYETFIQQHQQVLQRCFAHVT